MGSFFPLAAATPASRTPLSLPTLGAPSPPLGDSPHREDIGKRTDQH